MLFSPRIKLKPLAQLCRRMSTALGAGIDIRRAWTGEAARATWHVARARYSLVAAALERGESLVQGLSAAGHFFPLLFCDMVSTGEETGRLSEVFARLAEHYEGQLKLRRVFLAAIAWPVLELLLAAAVIGALIVALGVIERITGSRVDVLGLGLVGLPGLLKYLAFLAVVGLVLFAVFQAARRGLAWTRPIQRAALRLPLLGGALQSVCLARLAWVWHLTLGTDLEVARALRLGLRAAGNARYSDGIPPMEAEIAVGNSIHRALQAADCLPAEFLDAVAVGEQAGSLPESMEHLAREYQDRARLALAGMSVLAAVAVFMAVAAVLVLLIIRLAMFYVGMIYDAMKI